MGIIKHRLARGFLDPAAGRGGTRIQTTIPTTATEWCEHYGVTVKNGVATLYKAVNDDFMSARGVFYTPGTVPVAADWDGGKAECGSGLHFSPSPIIAKEFALEAKKYVACPVALADMRAPKRNDDFPHKIKARGCCAPVWECDIWGERKARTPTRRRVK